MIWYMKKLILVCSFNVVFGFDILLDEDLVDGFWEVINYNNGCRVLYKLIDYMW